MEPLHVMVTNANRRKAIPIIRSLGKAGMIVTCADSDPHAAGFFSRYCKHKFVYPDVNSDGFLNSFIERTNQHPCDVIFPLDDDVLNILSANRHKLPNPSALLLPDDKTISLANDKSRLVTYAAKLGISVPKTVIIRSKDDIPALDQIELPAVIKPSSGSGSRGIVFVDNREKLRWHCWAACAEKKCVLVQERLPVEGEGLGYFALYDRNHNLVAQFMHRRLREYPLSGGPSTLRESIWDEELADQARTLLDSLKWVGLAMVEFKRDFRDNKPKLMEINPRFWGSVALPIFSGVDFPVLTAKVTTDETVEPIMDYSVGKRARWLWPGDMLHLVSSVRQGQWPKGFLTLWNRQTCLDLISVSDPMPAIAFTFSNLKSLCSPKGREHLLKRSA